ncbi:MAG TPA: TonB-dependent receptor plug domain-containing protein, partial [Myxococcota bacterium]|nr:TonB-dependent receptor plug domain-containing protein [Myxococcota bacterium]
MVAACALALAGPARAADTDHDLADLSLDQLMGIPVTSASKKEQNADEVSSAIFVLTQDDIRRSGATTIPEVLRLVPGVQVARSTANGWAVTARGFNGRFASKLLVLMDGRSVYTPLFSGVYWDVQDTMMEDIDRIEVIRGPGATVWGANAVNGVINIITKSAKDTHGLLASAGGGNEERGFGGARLGGEPIDGLHVRGYAKYFNRDGQQN